MGELPPLNPIMSIFDLVLELGLIVANLYLWCIFIYVVFNWLFALDFLQRHRRIFKSKPHTWGAFEGFFRRIVEPAMTKIRYKVPRTGNLDLSPLILILIIYFIINLIQYIRFNFIYGLSF